MSDVVNKLWGFCHTLRHDGVDYGDYIEQITYLLFLKMADETGKVALPDGCTWPDLVRLTGTALTDGYVDILRALGKTPGILGDIYAGAQSRFANPVSLKKLIGLIDDVQWTALATDVKADAYEGLLEKAASEGKKGAGQYFTPRVAIQSIVRCIKPDPRAHADFAVCDPACGTAGFLVSSYEWLVHEATGRKDRDLWKRVRRGTYFGEELVARPRRLALMNLYLHGVEPTIRLRDALYETPLPDRFNVVLTNPPFGTKGANASPDREDFTIATSNKQLNFVQHVLTILKPGGRAAMVLPDNCLFADKAGEVLEILTQDCELHTVLRLPRGTFTPYSHGVRANVLFLTKGYATERTWIYDARTGVPQVTKKERPLTLEHFTGFERCYGADPNGRSKRQASDSADDRWRSFHISEVKEFAFKLDRFKWLTDGNGDDEGKLPEPEEVIARLQERLRLAADEVNALADAMEGNGGGT